MRKFAAGIAFCGIAISALAAQQYEDFSGEWRLNAKRSTLQDLPTPPDPFLRLENKGPVLFLSGSTQQSGPFHDWTYPLDRQEVKRKAGDSVLSTVTKWEGSALLVNTIVSGPRNYTIMERWKRSRDGSTLTVKRTVVTPGRETESVLVYENPSVMAAAAVPALRHEEPQETAETYVVDTGTRILLSLVNSVNTKSTATGDRVYLQTEYPVMSKGRIVIPRGSYVIGTVTESKRAGRIKDKASLYIRFDSLTLPNGTTRDFRSRIGSVDDANLDRSEGKISGEGNKGGDARTVGATTAGGAAVGSIAGSAAGHAGMGAGIGAAAGAAAGLIGVLASRGPDLVLQKGTTMEMVLDRELRFTAADLP